MYTDEAFTGPTWSDLIGTNNATNECYFSSLGFSVKGLVLRTRYPSFRVQDLGFRFQGLGFRGRSGNLWKRTLKRNCGID